MIKAGDMGVFWLYRTVGFLGYREGQGQVYHYSHLSTLSRRSFGETQIYLDALVLHLCHIAKLGRNMWVT